MFQSTLFKESWRMGQPKWHAQNENDISPHNQSIEYAHYYISELKTFNDLLDATCIWGMLKNGTVKMLCSKQKR